MKYYALSERLQRVWDATYSAAFAQAYSASGAPPAAGISARYAADAAVAQLKRMLDEASTVEMAASMGLDTKDYVDDRVRAGGASDPVHTGLYLVLVRERWNVFSAVVRATSEQDARAISKTHDAEVTLLSPEGPSAVLWEEENSPDSRRDD